MLANPHVARRIKGYKGDSASFRVDNDEELRALDLSHFTEIDVNITRDNIFQTDLLRNLLTLGLWSGLGSEPRLMT